MTKRNYKQERDQLVRDLRKLVVNFNGPVEESPHYAQLARLLVSDCITGNYPKEEHGTED